MTSRHQGVGKQRPGRLLDEDYEVRLEELKDPGEYAAVVATEPLTDEGWKPMEPYTLYVFYNGDLLLTVEAEGGARLRLSPLEAEVLRTVRGSPHSVKLGELADALGLDPAEVYKAVERLRNRGLLRQHSRDTVAPDHPDARYYTNPMLRSLIDRSLGPAS
jgi:hypothetical protein